MAKPTTMPQGGTPPNDRSSSASNPLAGAAANAAALSEGLALLRALHESGILEALTALAQQGNAVLDVALDNVSEREGYTRGARNTLTLAQTLGSLDEATVATTRDLLVSGLDAFAAATPPAKPLGVFDLLRALKDPDVSAGLAATLALLKGIGAAQRARQQE